MQDNTTAPQPATEGHGQRITDSDGNTTVNITVTASDPEVQAIEAVLVILQMMTYDTRIRILRYVRDRVETDPNIWGEGRPEPGPARPLASPADIARVLAEADGRDWESMNLTGQSPYYRRADALLTRMLVEIK